MSTTLNAKLLMKKGAGTPGTSLDLGEFGYDTSNALLYIGNGVGNAPVSSVTQSYVENNYIKKITQFSAPTAAYTVSASDNNNVIDASGTYNVTFPNTLPVGFSTTVINIGPGVITLNASTMYTTDASVALRDKYAGASVICKSAGVFYGIGNLK